MPADLVSLSASARLLVVGMHCFCSTARIQESPCSAGFNLEQPAVHEMMKAFDPQRTGEVQYGPYIGEQQAAASHQVLAGIRQRCHPSGPVQPPEMFVHWLKPFVVAAAMTLFLRSAVNTFKAFDPQGSGRVNMDFSQFIYAASHCR